MKQNNGIVALDLGRLVYVARPIRQVGRAYLGAGPGRGRSTGFRVAMATLNWNSPQGLGESRTLTIEKRDMAASTSTGAVLRSSGSWPAAELLIL